QSLVANSHSSGRPLLLQSWLVPFAMSMLSCTPLLLQSAGRGTWVEKVTEVGVPGLNNMIVAVPNWGAGAVVASNRKLYIVPHRSAFAFWLVANVSVANVTLPPVWVLVQSVRL